VFVFEGLPNLVGYVTGLATRLRQRGSLQVVVYHVLGDLVNAAEHALIHYFPLTLAEPFLQNSSIGTPYQKWAKITNEDFEHVDQCVRLLLPLAWGCYEKNVWDRSEDEERPFGGLVKDTWIWLNYIRIRYNCCIVDQYVPTLTISTLHLDSWVDTDGRRVLNVDNLPRWARPELSPQIVTESAFDIADRGTIAELQRIGLTRLDEMRRLNDRFATWIRTHCTMEEITAPHQGTLDNSLSRLRPRHGTHGT
jgi:hypothetical protein